MKVSKSRMSQESQRESVLHPDSPLVVAQEEMESIPGRLNILKTDLHEMPGMLFINNIIEICFFYITICIFAFSIKLIWKD
jgi:hypothetical protein